MTEINYVRNLSGACLTVVRGAPQLGLPIPPRRKQWGFCTTRSLLAACRRRVEPSCSAIPPDWCRRQPRVSRLGPADQAARLSETPVAFAGAGRVSTETGIAFAGEKWVYLVRFSAALVTVVSTVAGQGRAVVMAVSYWPVSAVAEVSLVASSPRAGSCARKSSPGVRKMAENRWFVACWTSFFAPTGVVPRTCRQCGALQACCGGGFAPCEAL